VVQGRLVHQDDDAAGKVVSLKGSGTGGD
jgi:hypothetical protein